ncbi:MAG: LysR family transcriptional regulator [Myxococcota bacterium]
MDLEALRVVVAVAELASFTRAAEHLGLSKSRASLMVQALEAELGIRLLQRTTRSVHLTQDGEQFVARAKRLVVDADDLGAMFQAPRNLRGRVRIDLPVGFARNVIIPRVPELLAAHPLLELQISATDRRVDLVREGFDLVLRVGALADSGLAQQRLGLLPMVNLASPGYLAKYGVPTGLADLDRHLIVHYSLTLGAEPAAFEYKDGAVYRQHPMRSLVTVNNADAYQAACRAGLGIIQVPHIGVDKLLDEGTLIEVLPDLGCEPMPVSLVHGHGRYVPKRVRAVMSWIAQLMEAHLAPQAVGARR